MILVSGKKKNSSKTLKKMMASIVFLIHKLPGKMKSMDPQNFYNSTPLMKLNTLQ